MEVIKKDHIKRFLYAQHDFLGFLNAYHFQITFENITKHNFFSIYKFLNMFHPVQLMATN